MTAHKIAQARQQEKNEHISLSMTENAHTKKIRLGYAFFAVIIATAFISSAVTLTISASGPTGFGTVIEPGSMVGECEYIVFGDSGSYYLKNARTGGIETSSTNASAVINSAIGFLTSDRTWQEQVSLVGDIELSYSIVLRNYTHLKIGGNLRLSDGAETTMVYGYYVENVTVEGGYIDGNKANNPIGACDVILFDQSNHITIRGVHIDNSPRMGISVNRQTQASNESTRILDNTISNSDVDGIYCQGLTNATISRNTILTCGDTGIACGGYSDNRPCERCLITDNEIYGCNVGVYIARSAVNVVVSNNILEAQEIESIYLNFFSTSCLSPPHDCLVSSNSIRGTGGNAIMLRGNNASYPIHNISIRNNVVFNPNVNAGSYYGIENIYCRNITITSNTVLDTRTPKLMVYGLNMYESDYFFIEQNTVNGLTKGMQIVGTHNVVRYNYGYTTEVAGKVSATGSVWSIEVTHGLASTPRTILITALQTGSGNCFITGYSSTTLTISFDTAPNASTWYFYYYAQTW